MPLDLFTYEDLMSDWCMDKEWDGIFDQIEAEYWYGGFNEKEL